MLNERHCVRQLTYCDMQMFGDMICISPMGPMPKKLIQPIPITVKPRSSSETIIRERCAELEKRRASMLVDELLVEIYSKIHAGTDYASTTSARSHKSLKLNRSDLIKKDVTELSSLVGYLSVQVERAGGLLVRRLKRRDVLRRQQEARCDVITGQLEKLAPQDVSDMRFTIQPPPGESSFGQWAAAMKMVAQLPGGIPPEFRSRLWLTLAEKHLASRNIDWQRAERTCFSEWSHPADSELGVQIVKDLHRTGCSLFCGKDGQENQALLKRVLLAYARWNKAVGYCQGFNMLAALILQVTDRNESDSLKLMIYLIEGVLPESYFADSLRGLSVDMAVFRELLRTRLPRLSRHLNNLQNAAKDGTTSYEPPLTNVFTMQWFLTLFCNCLPHPTVLRVWDLILLEGNEILLRTALAIWQALAERIQSVRSADEFYCIMGVLTRELLEFDLIDGNTLIKSIVEIGPLTELKTLREHYMYNINPWGTLPPTALAQKQLKVYPKENFALDIGALKKQYAKLKQRQRQAHIIFTAAITRQPSPGTPVAMNHLLLGKSALVPTKRLAPPKGTIPPPRGHTSTLHWKDTPKPSSSSSSSDTELCDEDEPDSASEEDTKPQLVEDNRLESSDTNLMSQDNITVEGATADSINLSQNIFSDSAKENQSDSSDIFVNASTIELKVESDDESGEFENFLADRIRCLKQSKSEEAEETEENRLSSARRNSEKALQIIQENSVILHRILQCQSRLSPSPPPIERDLTSSTSSPSLNSPLSSVYSSSTLGDPPMSSTLGDPPMSSTFSDTRKSTPLWSESNESSAWSTSSDLLLFEAPNLKPNSIKSYVDELSNPPMSLSRSPSPLASGPTILPSRATQDQDNQTYGSKYSNIIAKSRNLDEKYNTLILNKPSVKDEIKSLYKDAATVAGTPVAPSLDIASTLSLATGAITPSMATGAITPSMATGATTPSMATDATTPSMATVATSNTVTVVDTPSMGTVAITSSMTTVASSIATIASTSSIATPSVANAMEDPHQMGISTGRSSENWENFQATIASIPSRATPSVANAMEGPHTKEISAGRSPENRGNFQATIAPSRATPSVANATEDPHTKEISTGRSPENRGNFQATIAPSRATPSVANAMEDSHQRDISVGRSLENRGNFQATIAPSRATPSVANAMEDPHTKEISAGRSPENRGNFLATIAPSRATPSVANAMEDPHQRDISVGKSPENLVNFRMDLSTRAEDLRAFKERKKKSPVLEDQGKVFNPFPVPLSSRQNKDVGLKLGLYKK